MVPVPSFPSCLAPSFAWKNPPNAAGMVEVLLEQLLTVQLPVPVPAGSLQRWVDSENRAMGRAGTGTLSALPSETVPELSPQLLVTTQAICFSEDSCSGISEKTFIN